MKNQEIRMAVKKTGVRFWRIAEKLGMEINKTVGMNLRKYRTASKMTLQELSHLLHKSVSTISKYENGDIPLDVPTLMKLAQIFQTSPQFLLAGGEDEEPQSGPVSTEPAELRYVYTYGSRRRSIVQSLMEQCALLGRPNVYKVQFFNNVQSLDDPGSCSGLYTGEYVKEGVLGTYLLKNRSSQYEYVMISCINSLVNPNQQLGLMSGLSNYTMLPVSLKVLISRTKLTDTAALKEALILSRQDFQMMKQKNCLTIQNLKL